MQAAKGIGIPQDLSDANTYFKIAADKGNIVDAMYEFAEMAKNGDGMEKADEKLACKYYKKAGLSGNAEAMHKASLLESKFLQEQTQTQPQKTHQKRKNDSQFRYTPDS